ncbi:MAG: helix-turn-helix transcriptional regulator [Candidatus Dormibacteria bacterium]
MEALLNLSDVARLVGISRARVQTLKVEGKLPPPATSVGRQPLWARDDIERWRIETGRTDGRALPGSNRVPPMELVNEEVVDLYPGLPSSPRAHLRLYATPGADREPVVILGQLEDNSGVSVTNAIEEFARYIAGRFRPGRDFLLIEHRVGLKSGDEPYFALVTFSGAPAARWRGKRVRFTSPEWHSISRAQVERMVGRAIVVYDPGTYTGANVESYMEKGYQSFAVLADPFDVSGRLRKLAALGDLLRRGERPRDDPAWLAAGVLAGQLQTFLSSYEEHPITSAPDAPVQQHHPILSAAERALLAEFPSDKAEGGSPDDEKRLVEACLALRHHPEQAAAMPSEISEAIETATKWLSPLTRSSHPDTTPSAWLAAIGDADRRYLQTVDWHHDPKDPEITARADLLARVAYLDDHPLRFGFDPFSRMVCLARDERAFAVEWPLNPPASPWPDQATVIGSAARERGGRRVYVHLPDGRVDLVPMDPDRWEAQPGKGPSFNWGYGGQGPENLAAALYRAAVGDDHRQTEDAYHPPGLTELSDLVRQLPSQGDFSITVGELRRLASKL